MENIQRIFGGAGKYDFFLIYVFMWSSCSSFVFSCCHGGAFCFMLIVEFLFNFQG